MPGIPKINDTIIEILSRYLEKEYGDKYTYEGFDNEIIEIYAFSKSNSDEKYSIISIGIQNDYKQIYISRVLIPPLLKYNRVGKRLIRIVYEIGVVFGYNTFVVQLTDSFKNRLLSRGALITNEDDILQIVETTNLIDPQDHC